MKRKTLTAITIIAMLMTGACSKKADEPVQKDTAPKPVTLTYAIAGAENGWAHIDYKIFEKTIKEKLPYITLNIEFWDNSTKGLEQMLAKGVKPDILHSDLGRTLDMKDLGLAYDMTDLIKKNNFDLNRFSPGVVESIRNWNDNKIYALGYLQAPINMFYNKDIFDRFGVEYPKDNMKWSEAIELAKKVTRFEGGQQIRGLDHLSFLHFIMPYRLPLVANNAAAINNPKYASLLSMFQTIYQIPGNAPAAVGTPTDQFLKGTLAMMPLPNLSPARTANLNFNWDLVTVPTFDDTPGLVPTGALRTVSVTALSEHKDDAFKVVSTILSDSIGMELSKSGNVSVLKSPEIEKVFATEMPSLKGKNIQALFKAAGVQFDKANSTSAGIIANGIFTKYVNQVLQNQTDVNSALRSAEDEINKQIAALPTK